MTVLNNTHNIGVRKSVYKKGSTINVNFEFLKNKKYLVVKAIDDSSKEKELAVGQDYSLDISDGLNGAYGVVTLLKDFDPSTEISLFREISATQKANMSSKVIFSSDFETALDRLTIMIQDLKVLINRQASKENLGIVQIGDNINVNEGLISVATAANDKLGLVKIGENLSIDADGTLDLLFGMDISVDKIEGITLPFSGDWNSVCYGGDKFVAVADSRNKAAYSYDGISWTETDLPYGDWNSVCYGGGRFVAVARSSDKAAYSTDGITWTETDLPYGAWQSVCYGGGRFVAVARSTNIAAHSEDGITWTQTSMPHEDWKSVCYGNGKFVAVLWGSSGQAAYSIDGITWTQTSMPYAYWESVCYGGGKFVAVATNNTIVAYSSDGLIWIQAALPPGIWRSVCYGNGKFVAVSYAGNIAAHSSDGINWTEMIFPPGRNWKSVCCGGGKFVAVANGSDNGLIIPLVPKVPSAVSITGNYNDLVNKPLNASIYVSGLMSSADKTKLDGVQYGAEVNVQSDWSVSDTQNDAYIKNKPALATVATSGNYNDLNNKPILSTVATSGKYSDLTEKLTAGENVQINAMTVSATDTTYNNATQSSDGLMSSDDKRKVDNLSTVATTGNYNDLSDKPTNATTSADGFMSKEDKIKLNAAMKFPDGEAGYTLPDAVGRADKLISFDNLGSVKLQEKYKADYGIEILANNAIKVKPARTGEYDDCFGGVVIKSVPENLIHNDNGYISVIIPAAKPTESGLMSSDDKIKLTAAIRFPEGETGAVLPDASARENKVLGFKPDGKTVEMKDAGANITAGIGLQKNGNEISLKPAFGGELGGVFQLNNWSADNDLLLIEPHGRIEAILPHATASTLGGIKVGSGLSIDDTGVLSAEISGGSNFPFVFGSGINFTNCDWSYSFLNTEANFIDVTYWLEKNTYIAAEGGNLWYSPDLNTWSKASIHYGNTKLINAVTCDVNAAYAVGEGGLYMYSTNGGFNWESQIAFPDHNFKGVATRDVKIFVISEGNIFEKIGSSIYNVFTNPNGGQFTGIKNCLDGYLYAFGYNGTIVRYNNGTWNLEEESQGAVIKDVCFQNNLGTTYALQNRLSSGAAILERSYEGEWSEYTANSNVRGAASLEDSGLGLLISNSEGRMYLYDVFNHPTQWRELPRLSGSINKIYRSDYSSTLLIAGHQAIYKNNKSIIISMENFASKSLGEGGGRYNE